MGPQWLYHWIERLGHFLCSKNEDDPSGETHQEDDVHAADGEDVHDDLTGGYDDRAELVVELKPVEEVDNRDGGSYRIEGVCYSHLGFDFIKTSTGKEGVNATLPVGLIMCR